METTRIGGGGTASKTATDEINDWIDALDAQVDGHGSDDGAVAAKFLLTHMQDADRRMFEPGDDLSADGVWYRRLTELVAEPLQGEAFARIMSRPTRDEFVGALRHAGVPADVAQELADLAGEAAARGMEAAVRDQALAQLDAAFPALQTLAASESTRGRLLCSLLRLPAGSERRAAVEQLGFLADPAAFARALDRYEAQAALQELMRTDFATFVDTVVRLSGDPVSAARLLADAGAGAPLSFDEAVGPTASGVPGAAAARPFDVSGAEVLATYPNAFQALLARVSAPVSAILADLDAVLARDSQDALDGLDAARRDLELGDRPDAHIVPLRDLEGTVRRVSAASPESGLAEIDLSQDSVLLGGVARLVDEQEDARAAWQQVEWGIKLAVRVATALVPGGILLGAVSSVWSMSQSVVATAGVAEEARGYIAAGAASARLLDGLQGEGDPLAAGLLEAAADLIAQAAGMPPVGPWLFTAPAPSHSPFAAR